MQVSGKSLEMRHFPPHHKNYKASAFSATRRWDLRVESPLAIRPCEIDAGKSPMKRRSRRLARAQVGCGPPGAPRTRCLSSSRAICAHRVSRSQCGSEWGAINPSFSSRIGS